MTTQSSTQALYFSVLRIYATGVCVRFPWCPETVQHWRGKSAVPRARLRAYLATLTRHQGSGQRLGQHIGVVAAEV